MIPAPALAVDAEQEAASGDGTGLGGSPPEPALLETDVDAAAPAAAPPALPICGVPTPGVEGGDQASHGVASASDMESARSRSCSPVRGQEADMAECGDGVEETGRQGRGRPKTPAKDSTLHVVTSSITKVTKGVATTNKALRQQTGSTRSNRFAALAQDLAPPSQPSDDV